MAGWELSLSFLDSKSETREEARDNLVNHLRGIFAAPDADEQLEILVSTAVISEARPLMSPPIH